jgi:hypothetical protein
MPFKKVRLAGDRLKTCPSFCSRALTACSRFTCRALGTGTPSLSLQDRDIGSLQHSSPLLQKTGQRSRKPKAGLSFCPHTWPEELWLGVRDVQIK